VSLSLVAAGLAVALIPDLPLRGRHPGVTVRSIAGGPINRHIFAATRSADATRPSTKAVLEAVQREVAAISG
jgi:DNA-binding transcriptional LysR family regulator